MEQTAVFNQAQLHILQMLSYMKTPEELEELQNVISDYFAKKVDDEMDMQGLESYFENTPKEHFEEVWKDVEKYEKYGKCSVNAILCA